MKTILSTALLSLFLLVGCESFSTADLTRVSNNISILPKAADREGIYTIRDIRGSILVQYFPGQVSESEIVRRLTNYCARSNATPRRGSSATIRSEATLPDGSVVSTRSFVVQCR